MRKLGRSKTGLGLVVQTIVVLLVLSLIPSVTIPVSADASSFIKFENFDVGTIIESVSTGNGITGYEVDGNILIYGYNPVLPGNQAMIFDATCGGDASQCSGNDDDLYKPTLGNILIVSEDGNASDPNDSQFIGSTLVFDFSNWGSGKVTVNSIDVLDIEGFGGKIKLYSGGPAGTLIAVVHIPPTGNNGLATVPVDIAGVDFMQVILGGSGAIDNIQITAEDLGDEDDVADVAVSKQASAEQVMVGEEFNYTITVENLGPDAAKDVALTDYLPEEVDFISVSPDDYCSLDGAVYCYWPEIANGASEEVQLVVTATTVGTATNTVDVTAATDDPDPEENNSASVDVIINPVPLPEADLQVVKRDAVDPVTVGSIISYTITISNAGPDLADYVYLTDSLPAGTSFASVTPGTETASCGEEENTIYCNLGDIPPGESLDVVIEANALAAGVITNTVNVSSETTDPDLDNNSDSEPTVVISPEPLPAPTLLVAFQSRTTPGNLNVGGLVNGAPDTDYSLNFYSTCDEPSSEDIFHTVAVTTDTNGYFYSVIPDVIGTQLAVGNYISVTAMDINENISDFSQCKRVDQANNTAWFVPLEMDVAAPAEVEQYVDQLGQSRWFRFRIEPDSKVFVTLTGLDGGALPANYDLTIYKDIKAAFQEYLSLDGAEDLVPLTAEFAADAFSADAFSADAFSADAFSADAFSADAFSADAFSADAFSADAFSADAFSADAFSADAFSADAFSADAFSADAFSADAFSADAFSADAFSADAFSADAFSADAFSADAFSAATFFADAFSADAFSADAFSAAFSSAQSRSLIGVSAFNGTASEGLFVNSWNNTGDFYVRVRGRNGAFNPNELFKLVVRVETGSCSGILKLNQIPELEGVDPLAPTANPNTLILVDESRINLDVVPPGETQTLRQRLTDLAAHPTVNGHLVNVGADLRVQLANQQADANPTCPFAKNQVALAIRDIVKGYAGQPGSNLQYITIIGDDEVVPFYRHPDNATLAPESNYAPPVSNNTASQASLKLNYVLGQDFYGAKTGVSLKNGRFPLPQVPVGRLVETEAEIYTMINAYLSTNGVIDKAAGESWNSLVTGYDFLEDAALEIRDQLRDGTQNNTPPVELITSANVPPTDPLAWTADQLRTALLTPALKYDLIFWAGHFSGNSALAADYTTRLEAVEVANATNANLTNVIIFSAGCHSGYNIIDEHGTIITKQPDWAQAFAQKGATLIGGTGYQYGDTDFLEYSERIYLEFARQLRVGSGPVSIGEALVNAKRVYISQTPPTSGLHEKALLESTIFGLPMLSVNLPGRIPAFSPPTADVTAGDLVNFPGNVGTFLGLQYYDLPVQPALTEVEKTLNNVEPDAAVQQVTANYLRGSDGVAVSLGEPVLPMEQYNVGVPNTVLRGVGFRGGTFQQKDVFPLTGAATTELRGVHTPFLTDYFYPIQMWKTNFFGALSDPNGGITTLQVTPAQHKISPISGTPQQSRRNQFNHIDLRLYYSGDFTDHADEDSTVPFISALSGAPAIVKVLAEPDPDNNNIINFRARVVGNPAAGIGEVWVNYIDTGVDCPVGSGTFCTWQYLLLTQNPNNTSMWGAQLDLNSVSIDSGKLRYMVQAVNGVGLVSRVDNLGEYFQINVDPGAVSTSEQAATNLALLSPPTQGVFGTKATFQALLTDGNETPLAEQTITFRLGSQTARALTNQNGVAEVTLALLGLPDQNGDGAEDPYAAGAAFGGTKLLAPSFDRIQFTILKANTQLSLTPGAANVLPDQDPGLVATLTDQTGRPLREKTIFFVVTGDGGSYSTHKITNWLGQASLGPVPLPAGGYDVNVYFSGGADVNLLNAGEVNTINLADPSYNYTALAQPGLLTVIAPTAGLGNYAVFGLNSVWLRAWSQLHGGDVGVQDVGVPPFLYRRHELVVSRYVTVNSASALRADSVLVERGAQVGDIFANDWNVDVRATSGNIITPVDLPLLATLPSLPDISPGTENVVLAKNDSLTLSPGAYGKVTLKQNSVLYLSAGVYHLDELDVDKGAQVLISGGPVEVRIAGRFKSNQNAVIAPAPNSGLSAADLVFYVAGINGKHGHLLNNPKAVLVGINNRISANIYAPNGTVWLRWGTEATGAFIGKDVRIGRRVTVQLDSAF